jgi:hypothetical protein
MVNRPSHYNQGGIECIDAIKAALGEEGFKAYCRGNALKYTWRAGLKLNEVEDLKKAAWYNRMAAGDDPRKDNIQMVYNQPVNHHPGGDNTYFPNIPPEVIWTISQDRPVTQYTRPECDTQATTTAVKVDPKKDPTKRWPSSVDELLY